MKFPYKLRLGFTRGMEAALRKILDDPSLRPPGITSIAGLIRHYVWRGITDTGMPLGPVSIGDTVSLGPVSPENDTVQGVLRRSRETQEKIRRHQEARAAREGDTA